MGINVVWKSWSGEELARLDDPEMVLSDLGDALDVSKTKCLRFIDPFGDAIFNQAQRPVLVQELAWAASRVRDPQLRSFLQAVRDLAERARDVHTYIWFEGD